MLKFPQTFQPFELKKNHNPIKVDFVAYMSVASFNLEPFPILKNLFILK